MNTAQRAWQDMLDKELFKLMDDGDMHLDEVGKSLGDADAIEGLL